MNGKHLFRVIIAGSRNYNDYSRLKDECDRLLKNKRLTHDIIIISGTARGADTLGEQYAREWGFKLQQFPADWKSCGKTAGIIRNVQMADNADALIAFWDGKSRGTAHMINTARKRRLPVRIVMF